jgi:outer membrane protein TolC
MAKDSERLAADAFTRASVESYLQAAAEQRARIELAIAEAERRRERAVDALQRLVGREPAVTGEPAATVEPTATGESTDRPTADPGSSPNGSGPEASR